MTATVERLTQQIESLAPDEANEFYRVIRNRIPPVLIASDDELSVQDDWDQEIDSRIKEIEEGRVELISGEQFQKNTDVLFAKLGIQRGL